MEIISLLRSHLPRITMSCMYNGEGLATNERYHTYKWRSSTAHTEKADKVLRRKYLLVFINSLIGIALMIVSVRMSIIVHHIH